MGRRNFLDHQLLESYDRRTFFQGKPFAWESFHRLLLPDAFETLYGDFPPLEMFSRDWGAERPYGQRPLNRYHLSYEGRENLPASWKDFIHELETSSRYSAFIRELVGPVGTRRRYTWHLGVTTSEVSPHVDDGKKLATHIFYFNKSGEWDPAWGGRLLILENKKTPAMNPDFSDFEKEAAVEFTDNRSVLFKNEANAWHGVRPLSCPDVRTRRLFNVIFSHPKKSRPAP